MHARRISLDRDVPARLIADGTALLASAVLADSGLEHYRGSFRNPFMVAPLAASSAVLAASIRRVLGRTTAAGRPAHRGAMLTGAAGLCFHLWNVMKRPGGFSWNNVFYGAPLGAPAALLLAGVLGEAGAALQHADRKPEPIPIASGRPLGLIAAVGLAGTVAEAGFLHFRGAYHNPFMWAPVSLPPIAALSLARDAIDGEARSHTRYLLIATAALGVAGVGFHIYGVHRNMGGWYNWKQNILAGPPIPAPPAFTGLALAGLAALMLLERRRSS